MIEVDLAFDGDKVKGSVFTPVAGTFEWKGNTILLKAGKTSVSL
jgi:hypothetical protein